MLKVIGASWTQTRVSTMILAAVAALGVVAIILGEMSWEVEDGKYSATVTWTDSSGFRVDYWGQGNDLAAIPRGVARAVYSCNIESTGWAVLEVQSRPHYPDWVQAFAAGLLEGSLSWLLIYNHWSNTVRDACMYRQEYCRKMRLLAEKNEVWAKGMAAEKGAKDPFWHQVGLFYHQLDGLETGWRHGVQRSRQEVDIPHVDFLWMNMSPDLVDLEERFGASPDLSRAANMSSSFVRLLPTGQMFIGHNSGGLYRSMLRIVKRYDFGYHVLADSLSSPVHGRVSSFTSYPGAIFSQDDLYVVSGGGGHQLVVAGNAISNHNPKIWERVPLESKLLIGPRVMAANRLAHDGRYWGRLLSKFSSGSGNKQWLLMDIGKLRPPPTTPEPTKSAPGDVRLTHVTQNLMEVAPGREVAYSVNSPPPNEWTKRGQQSLRQWEEQVLKERLEMVARGGVIGPQGETLLMPTPAGMEKNEMAASEVKKPPRQLHPKKYATHRISAASPLKHRTKSDSHKKGLMWLIEQIPGLTHYSDLTQDLQRDGYFATTGIPYFDDISEMSGTTTMKHRFGPDFSPHSSPRARSFMAGQQNITDVTSAIRLMRSLDGSDPESLRVAIAGRDDLGVPAEPAGVIDSKVVMAGGCPTSLHAIAGPSFTHGDNSTLPVGAFKWSSSAFNTEPHVGQPDVWQFNVYSPTWVWEEEHDVH